MMDCFSMKKGQAQIISAIGALVIIFIFISVVFPALKEITGQNTSVFTFALIIMAMAVVLSVFKVRL